MPLAALAGGASCASASALGPLAARAVLCGAGYAEASCTGLWVGPALGKCSCQNQLEVIVGKSQTFAVYSIDRSNKTVNLATPRYESEGLGWNLGAFNSIEVLREQVDPENSQKRVDYLFIGSDAYVYAYKSPSYTVGGGHQH